jgi:large subunit ribosomal protein L21
VFAVISLGGKQYRVRKGEYLTVDRLAHDAGSTFSPVVLLATSGDDVSIDAADLAKITVTARVDEHLLGPKIRVMTYKPKKSSKKARGHRSRLSRITIEDIAVGTAKKAAAKAEAATEEKPAAAEKPAAPKKPAAAEKPAATPKPSAAAKPAAPEKAAAAEKPAAPRKPAAPKKPAAEKKPAAPKKPAARKPAAKKPADEQEA